MRRRRWHFDQLTSTGIHGFLIGNATIFNSPIGQACSWNRSQISEMAKQIATEAKALGVSQLFAPLADLARELRYGRVEETYGEDSYLAGEMAGSYVSGLQGEKVMATVKHYTAFSAPEQDIGKSLLDSVGYTVIAIAVFGVAKYILEEEVIDPTQMRNAGQARRSITKFVSTISIAVFLEALVVVFQTSKGTDLSMMLYPTILMFSGVMMVVGLGVYQRLSTSAEREVRSSPAAAAEEQAELDKF